MARILAVGGAHIDRKGWLDAPHRPGASNPGRWQSEPGGGAFNAARNLARLGHQITLVSPRGGDEAAELVARAAREAGIEDCPLTFLDRATPSYTAILEPDGNLVTALADMALYDAIPPRRLMSSRFKRRMAESDLLLADANLPESALAALAKAASTLGLPTAALAVSPAKVVRWRPSLSRLAWLSMNEAEAASLSGQGPPADWPSLLVKSGLDGGLVSAGGGPVAAFSASASARLSPPPPGRIEDVTGAGDALLSGFLDGWLAGGDIAANLARGVALAQLTLAVQGPVRPDLSQALLAQAVAAMAKP